MDVDGNVRDGGDVAEVTDLLDLTRWPAGMRVIIRRERPHPGAQLSLFEEADGWRYQAVATNTQVGQLAFLEARHRAHARVEDRIRHAKDSGLGRFPSREFAINQAWLQVVSIAADLTAWLRLLALPDDPQGVRAEGAALPAPARPSPTHPRRPATTAAAARDLAVGRADQGRLRRHHRDPRTDLNTGHRSDRPPPETSENRTQRHAALHHTHHRRHPRSPMPNAVSRPRE